AVCPADTGVPARHPPPHLLFARRLGRHLTGLDPPSPVMPPPPGDGDVFLESRHLEGEGPVGIEAEAAAVEHQLVLPADLVEISERQPRLGDPGHRDRKPRALLPGSEGRAMGNEQQLSTGLEQGLADILGPDALADRPSEPYAAKHDWPRRRSRREYPLLVEHP